MLQTGGCYVTASWRLSNKIWSAVFRWRYRAARARQRLSSYIMVNRSHVHGCMSPVSRTHTDTLTLLPRPEDPLLRTARSIHLWETTIYTWFHKAVAMVISDSHVLLANKDEGRNECVCMSMKSVLLSVTPQQSYTPFLCADYRF